MTDGTKRLYRSRDNRVIAGVLGGVGEYLNVDPTVVRVLFVILSIFPGTIIGGLIVYVVLALLMPERPATAASHGAPATYTGTPPPPPPSG